MPSCAPRPVPTSSAVGVARPSAHGQAMISTATAAVNAAVAPPPVPSQKPSVPAARAITTGTKTAEIRSASRCTAALPFCASSTSRAIWASWVSAPTRVARTSSRPPAFTVAPVTGSPARTSTGTDSPVSRLASIAETPSTTTPSVAIFSPGRTRNVVADREVGRPGSARSAPSRSDRDGLRAELEQRAQRVTGPALRAGLEIAPGQQERGHAGGGFEIDRRRRRGRSARTGGSCRACAGVAEEQRPQRPAERGQRAHRDQRVHGRRAVPQVDRGRPGGTASRRRRRPARPASATATASR